MRNYEELIWDRLPGNTPKDKYDYLIELERDIIRYKSAATTALTFCIGLKDTPDTASIGNLRSIIEANYEYFTKIDSELNN